MTKRRSNYRLVKIHRSYTAEDIARLFGIHKNTVRHWIKAGLPTIDDRRPMLVRGPELRDFLQARRTSRKQSCRPGQIYCVRCRAPQSPAGRMAEYQPINDKIGNLLGICPDCNLLMYRCVSMAKLSQVRGEIDITFPQALRHLTEIGRPTVNSDLRGDVEP